jgi:hypothetical protein
MGGCLDSGFNIAFLPRYRGMQLRFWGRKAGKPLTSLVQDLPSPVVQFVFLSGGYGVVVADCSCIREQPCVTVPLHYLVFIFSTNSTIHAETKKN